MDTSGFALLSREVLEVSTVFDKCIEELEIAIKSIKPDLVICVGQAGGKSHGRTASKSRRPGGRSFTILDLRFMIWGHERRDRRG